MKYLFAIVLSASVTLGLSSCAKEACYTCESTVSGCTADICDGGVTYASGAACGGGASTGSTNAKNESLKNSLESAGYTCTKK